MIAKRHLSYLFALILALWAFAAAPAAADALDDYRARGYITERYDGYTQVRGAEGKLPGPSVYLCGYAPFDHTIDFELR